MAYQNLRCFFITTQQGASPLYVASQQGHLQVVQVLLEYGTSVNLVNNVNYYSNSIILLYLPFHVNDLHANVQDEQRDSALLIACLYGYSDIAKVLLDQGAMINYHNQVSLIMAYPL